ncbi:MAG: MerR family transcriptional regulator [Thiohalomonadales bacterium]
MFTVSELAKKAEVTADTVRHYVHVGLLSPERNPINGYKYFDNADITRVRFVRQAKNLGFTLADIGEILDHSMHGDSPCPQVREIIQCRISENRAKLEALNILQQHMEDALLHWQSMPDGLPDGESICHLIESLIPVTHKV